MIFTTLKSRAAWSRTCSFRSALRRVFLFRLCAALCSLSPDEPSSALYRNIYGAACCVNGLHDASFWVMITFIFVFLMLFNKVVPNLHLRFREVWPGALFSLVAWILVSLGFSFYVDNMARYSVLYGSLAAIIVLMLWLYIVSMILLMGPQLNHTLVVMRLYRLENEKHI